MHLGPGPGWLSAQRAWNDDASHDGAPACRPPAGVSDAVEGLLALLASQASARVVRDVRETSPIFRFASDWHHFAARQSQARGGRRPCHMLYQEIEALRRSATSVAYNLYGVARHNRRIRRL